MEEPAHRAELGGGEGVAAGREALTFTLLTASTAAAVAEAGVLVRGREAGRGPRVLVGVALPQGPGGGRVGQRGQRVLIRGPAGAAVEVQRREVCEGVGGGEGGGWRGAGVGAGLAWGGRGAAWAGPLGTPPRSPYSLLHRSPKT